MLFIESGLAVLAIVIAFIYPQAGSHFFEAVEHSLPTNRKLTVLTVGVAALALRMAILPAVPIPEPTVHDEFGYLLAADTFAHGRLTNPTHPLYIHFETFSVLQRPTYQCFGQPAQGLVLAAGKLIAGHPFWGVWFTMGLMCAAICWMLQGWMSPRWALLGGMLAVLRFGALGYWGNSYWGGAIGALGGALVLGALPRIKRQRRVRDASIMGLGLAILANNRPYEGFVLCLPVAFALFAWLVGKNRPPLLVSLRAVILPLCLILGVAAAVTGYYFLRVTGSPFRMPYQVEKQTYAIAPYLLWQHLKPPPKIEYGSEQLRRMYVYWEPLRYNRMRTAAGFAVINLTKSWVAWKFFLGPILTAALLMVLVALPSGFTLGQTNKRTRFLLVTLVGFMFGLAVEVPFSPHYAAPITGLLLLLVLLGLRRLQVWCWRGRRTGLFFVRAVPTVCLMMFALRIGARPLHIPLLVCNQPGWSESGTKEFGRAAVLAELQKLPGHQLVIVRYKPEHFADDEWVYNDADIDASRVVWAREMDMVRDEALVRYFRDRRVWLLEADERPPKLSPYQVDEPR